MSTHEQLTAEHLAAQIHDLRVDVDALKRLLAFEAQLREAADQHLTGLRDRIQKLEQLGS